MYKIKAAANKIKVKASQTSTNLSFVDIAANGILAKVLDINNMYFMIRLDSKTYGLHIKLIGPEKDKILQIKSKIINTEDIGTINKLDNMDINEILLNVNIIIGIVAMVAAIVTDIIELRNLITLLNLLLVGILLSKNDSIFFSIVRIPKVEKTERIKPMSPAANGLDMVNIHTDTPNEFKGSGFLVRKIPR